MTEALVSVIVPAFNRPGLLREAVLSVQAQTHRNWECLIVDDGSDPAEAAEIARLPTDLADERIRLLRQQHGGPGAARNRGLRNARGEFIQYLDSDDLLHPEKLARQTAQLRQNAGADLSYCVTTRFRNKPGERDVPSGGTGRAYQDLTPHLLEGRIWHTLSALWRRSACDRIGDWSGFAHNEDWEYECRAAILGMRAVRCPQVLCYVRDHEQERASVTRAEGTDVAILQRLRDAGLASPANAARLATRFLTAARRHLQDERERGRRCLQKAWHAGSARQRLICAAIRMATALLGPRRGIDWLERIRERGPGRAPS